MLKYAIPVLHISRADAAQKFYCNGLGFRLRMVNRADESLPDPCYMSVERDGVWLHLSSFPGDGVAGGVVYLAVESVDAIHAELIAKGVPIDSGPMNQSWGTRELYVKDDLKNCIRFIEELPGQ